jgi:hypothetical protein
VRIVFASKQGNEILLLRGHSFRAIESNSLKFEHGVDEKSQMLPKSLVPLSRDEIGKIFILSGISELVRESTKHDASAQAVTTR